ncbi:hypothetical protein BDM02DRAFT_1312339 [Thelephora ganbajun]|uniref:Uncharacterized protein n=1 Tax=Thelephora ganbajun TaxID=370292 RepID=A0ACB6Z3B2_THEGA|nr:hypothetical protein BDM02DRAFT_1312339 [Thelephora ganbajun]
MLMPSCSPFTGYVRSRPFSYTRYLYVRHQQMWQTAYFMVILPYFILFRLFIIKRCLNDKGLSRIRSNKIK